MSDALPICLPGTYDSRSPEFESHFMLDGFSGREQHGRWTQQRTARLGFRIADPSPILMTLELSPFILKDGLPRQRVAISTASVIARELVLDRDWPRKYAVFVPFGASMQDGIVQVQLDLPDAATPASFGINQDRREIGVSLRSVAWKPVHEPPPADDLIWQLGRPVGVEIAKTFDQKIESGFWHRFVRGPNILDIGFRGGLTDVQVCPILPGAIGVEPGYPGYDGITLPFADGSEDAVFSSHCLEHIPSHIKIIQDWFRVTRVGGFIITAVPHAHLYERRRRPPSRWNADHQRFYTSASLAAEFEAALSPNSYRIRLLEENDELYDYAQGPETHPRGCYEITMVTEKLSGPEWDIAE